MPDVFDGDGNLIADIPISFKQIAIMRAGAEATVIFHTPQLLRYLLGERSGSFSLRWANGRIVTRERAMVERFAELQRAIPAARSSALRQVFRVQDEGAQ